MIPFIRPVILLEKADEFAGMCPLQIQIQKSQKLHRRLHWDKTNKQPNQNKTKQPRTKRAASGTRAEAQGEGDPGRGETHQLLSEGGV